MAFGSEREVNRAIRAWVRAGPGDYPVIPGNEDAPSPNGLYATVLLIDDDQLGTGQTRVKDGQETVILDVTARYSLQFHRAGALDAARALRGWWHRDESDAAARTRGIQVYGVSRIRRVDLEFAGRMEERAVIDLSVAYRYSAVVPRTVIETVPVAVVHDDQGRVPPDPEERIPISTED